MNRRIWMGLGIIVGVAVIIGVILLARIWLVGGSGEASQPLVAPTLDGGAPTPAPTAAPPGVEATEEVLETGEAMADSAATTVAPTVAPAAAEAEAGARRRYRISGADSEVRFILDEMLRGEPTTVVGRTDQVAGEVLVDFAAPASSELGTLVINARTLATDNEFRNRALRSDILQSARDEFELITFTPTALTGLPASAADGDTVTFTVTGDLTIRDITHPETFTVQATVSAAQVSGSASAVVRRADYNLVIPNVPGVAEVSEEVLLEIDFVALPVE